MDLIITSPKYSARTLLLEINKSKSLRLINILYCLSNKFSFYITPEQILNKIGKINYKDLYFAKDKDIIELLVDNEYCNSLLDAQQNYFQRISLPRLSLPLSDTIDNLQKEEIWISQPIKFIERHIEFLEKISGFITSDSSSNIIMSVSEKYNLDIRYGSGSIVD
jgi:hypothetical protein